MTEKKGKPDLMNLEKTVVLLLKICYDYYV